MMPDHESPAGLFESIKGLAASGVGMVQTRLELLSVEVAEEKERFLSVIWFGLAALFFIGLSIISAAVLLAVALWENHRLLVLGMLALLFLCLGLAATYVAWKRTQEKTRPFAASLDELSKDLDHLQS